MTTSTKISHSFPLSPIRLFLAAAAIALLPAAHGAVGDVYVTRGPLFSGQIARVTPAGEIIPYQTVEQSIASAFDGAGNHFVLKTVTSTAPAQIAKITPSGTVSSFGGALGSGARDIAVDAAGNVYVTEGGSVRKFTATGAAAGTYTSVPGAIQQMTFDRAGNLYMSSSVGVVYRFSPPNVTSAVVDDLQAPFGVAVDGAGNLFVSDSTAGTIYKYTPSGAESIFATALGDVFNLAVDPSGNLYASSPGKVRRFKPNGAHEHFATLQGDLAFELPRGKLLNISTRLRVQNGDNALIGGFIINGGVGKRVIVRAIGPSLGTAGVQGALQDPVLELYNSSGAFVNGNDNWKSTQQAQIEATGVAPSHDRESALVLNLGAGSYTVVVRGRNDTTGVGLVEVYDLDAAGNSQLANISTRGRVETGENVMIGGVIVNGNGARMLIRALGPSLGSAGVPGTLADPALTLRDANGVAVAFNDDWRETQRDEIQGTGIPPSQSLESAIVAGVPNGNYTAIVGGFQGESGVGLIEFYNLQ